MRGANPRRWLTLACAALGLGQLLACPPASGPCDGDDDCAADQLCVDGRCVQVCNSAGDCAAGDECRDGVCRPRRDSGAADAVASDGAAMDRGLGEGGSADRWTPIDGPPPDQPTLSDGVAADLASTVDGSGLEGPLADQGSAADAADPCATARCPTNTTCLALYDGSVLCLCGDRACGENELCRLPDSVSTTAAPRCCGPAQLNCGGLCKDVLDDEANCGGCGLACAFGELCVQAQCACGGVGACDARTQDCCDGACRDVLVDEAHCGPLGTGVGCGFACPGVLPCVDGLCQCSDDGDCGAGLTCCDQRYCADLARDLHNCRACGAVCRPGEICGVTGCACSATCDDGDPCTEDRCTAGRCEHSTLDADDDGYCAPGCSDPSSVDCVDGDCNDADPDVNPIEDEVCDGKDNDCSAATADGADACAGYCCGTPRACQACCAASQCGTGSWECTASHVCDCDGLDCGGHCYASGACCDNPNLCGGCTTLPYQPGTLCGTCGAYQCQGTDAVVCSGDVAVDGGWTDYSYTNWSNDGACGQYTACKQRQTRTGTRTCTNPAPACGGAPCGGSATTTEFRELDCGLVDGGWTTPSYTNWITLGNCGQFVSCIQRETRSGTRTCTNPAPACGGATCAGDSTVTETRDTLACGLVNGGWSDFSYTDWSATGTCGQYVACKQRETRSGTRTCTNPAPACGGATCAGDSAITENRDTQDCGLVNGGWSDYSYTNWSLSGDCGQYVACRQREVRDGTRTCTDPAPACGGATCVGSTTTTEERDELVCGSVDGGWSDWDDPAWENVNACGEGMPDCTQAQQRTLSRSCTNPAPVCGGALCAGDATELQTREVPCDDHSPCNPTSPYSCCSGYCTDLMSDSSHCGYCNNSCSGGYCPQCCSGYCSDTYPVCSCY